MAALRNNMNFLGFELDKGTYELIQRRLSENILYWCKCNEFEKECD